MEYNRLSVEELTVGKIINRRGDPGAASTKAGYDQGSYVRMVGPTLTAAAANAAVQKMIDIPKGMTVTKVVHQVVAVSDHGYAHAGTLGDAVASGAGPEAGGGDVDGWDTTIDLKAATGTEVVCNGAYARERGITYVQDGVINFVHNVTTGPDATATGTHRVIVFGFI